ncbi:MAG: hypothetical protein P0Y49_14985 [Candidatus Pedobacter colombiensis]|uniref:Uncharacterized protein n=1 Tax=Candidatus Pedobacter colombiensis TaxID=3121371 RepID=A0AAJ5W4V5_9SPHI|nr:hypothetical protein [Pedobacter sp.]WEK18099.1 MAG: hypothetical protein P0Y49_14985 [Pedobacter sp.]
MKKSIYFMALIAVLCTLSCKKKSQEKEPAYTCSTCMTTPEALAANDATNKGIYKGVVIGSTGTIKFNIANTGTTITAILVLDGVTANLTSTVAWTAGQAYTSAFTGKLGTADVSITFSVDATGTTPVISTSSIPGHPNTSFNLIKETSTNLIECFEGTYSTTKPETGTFNIVLSRTLRKFKGSSRTTGSTTSNPISGTIDSNNNLVEDGNIICLLSGDELNGSFTDNDGKKVTVKGKRTF